MVEGKQKDAGDPKASDPTSAIRQIDVHGLTVDEVYTCFSTSPNIGLDRLDRASYWPLTETRCEEYECIAVWRPGGPR